MEPDWVIGRPWGDILIVSMAALAIYGGVRIYYDVLAAWQRGKDRAESE